MKQAGRIRASLLIASAAALALSTLAATTSASGQQPRAATTRVSQPNAQTLARPDYKAACAAARAGHAACLTLIRTSVAHHWQPADHPDAAPTGDGYGPSSLQSAYDLPSSTAGSGQTVAVVDAYNDPDAASDLATYRAAWGLPACGSGCFSVVNENGQASPLPSPASGTGWDVEESLDVDMVSAICPLCHIILVEANSASFSDLGTAENSAVSLGAKFISNSYGGADSSSDTTYDAGYYNHPGVAITASAGDDGYGVEYPAASEDVTAVGGTTLTQGGGTRGWTETVWGSSSGGEGTGSGCSGYEPKPSWQTDTGCTHRTNNDVAADANPNSGVAVYDSYTEGGWLEVGGTSEASPIIASVFALAGTPTAGTYPSSYIYAHTGDLFDVTSGTDGSCSPSYLCTAGTGYDGPTGWGTPDGTGAFTQATASGNPPAATVTANGTAYVFWKGTGGNLYEAQGPATGALSGPYNRGMGVLGSPPAAGVDSSGATYVYWEGTDGNLYEAYWNGSAWVGPYNRGMGPLGSAPTVAITGGGTAYVFWKGTNGNLYEAQGPATGALSGPVNLGMGTLGSAPTAGVNSSGATYVYWEGTDGNLWEGYWNGSAWVGPYSRGMGPLGSAPTVAITGGGTAYVFWKSAAGNLYQAQGPATGALSGPVNLGMGPLGSAPSAGVNSSGATYVYWEGTDGNLWEGYWNGSAWVGPYSRGMGPLG
jgi:hypothetical protein